MKLKEKYYNYRLCYVEGNMLYFTSDFETQWGDDWDDAPYDCNADVPYEDGKHKIIKICIDKNNLSLPCDFSQNCHYSVEKINKGAAAWLFDKENNIAIQGGMTFSRVVQILKENNNEIYYPIEIIETI